MRPIKEGLDYFPVDVDMDQDDKVILIEAQHGVISFGILIRLLMKIYKEGYFYKWTEREQLLFSKRVNVNINLVNDIINDCLKWGIFDQTVYDKYQVLTSKGIQRRYLTAINRRQAVSLVREFMLVDPVELYKKTINYINVGNNSVNDNINHPSQDINDDISTQSKVKKRKEKNSKEPLGVVVDINHVYNEFSNNIHPITPMEMEYIADWLKEMPEEVIVEAIREAVGSGVRKWKYINGILQNWKSEGWTSLEAIQAARRDRADHAAKTKEAAEASGGISGEEAWLEVMLRINKRGPSEWSHSAIKDAVTSVGGLRAIGDCDSSSIAYVKSQFIKAYEVLSRRDNSAMG